ncbi:MAG: glycosyltransferase, partial [Alphaproteobacteria bacterium]|nr:glycosyltransferase [Alphaproteobacteria bacterium]
NGGFPENLPNHQASHFHQLPPVKARNGDFNDLIDENGQPINPEWWQNRQVLLLNLFEDIQPDIIVTESFPFARRKFKQELIPLLEKAKSEHIPIVASIRDILVDPKKPKKRQFAIDLITKFYEAVLIHGEKEITPLEASFPGTEAIADKLFYTGYVSDSFNDEAALKATQPPISQVIISAGGGAVGEEIYLMAAKAKANCASTNGIWRFLLGPNLPDAAKEKLSAFADVDKNIVLEDARPDFRDLLGNADLSISQFGYNTAMDILATGIKSISIPYAENDESEQTIRAEIFAKRNLTTPLNQKALTSTLLSDIIEEKLSQAENNPPQGHDLFDLDGATKSAKYILSLVKEEQ